MQKLFDGVLQGIAFTAMLVTLGCDAMDSSQFPVMKSELVVEDVNTFLNLPRFQWLDNDRLVVVAFDYEKSRPDNIAYRMDALVVWNPASNTTTRIVEPDVGGLCVRGEHIRYFKRKIDPQGFISRDSLPREHFVGPLGKGMPVEFAEPTDPMTCDSKKTQGGLPEWAQNIPEINIRRLKPEHGFVVIDRDSPSDWPRSVKMYLPDQKQESAIDLTKILGRSKESPITMGIYATWYPYKGAYYLRSVRSGTPSWWLYPDGKLDIAWILPKDGINFPGQKDKGTPIAATKYFPVTGVTDYDIAKARNGGLYSIADFRNPKRLVKGRIGQEIEVSPDGCKVAFANDDRWWITLNSPRTIHKLQVINLCAE